MAREIKGRIYNVKSYACIPHYVECDSKEDLFRYLAEEWVKKGYPFSGVNEICTDGTTPRVKVATDKTYKRILKEVLSNA